MKWYIVLLSSLLVGSSFGMAFFAPDWGESSAGDSVASPDRSSSPGFYSPCGAGTSMYPAEPVFNPGEARAYLVAVARQKAQGLDPLKRES